MTDPDAPMSLDPTLTFPRGDRRHDDKGTTDPAVLAAAQELDRALDRVLATARIMATWTDPGRVLDLYLYPGRILDLYPTGAAARLREQLAQLDAAMKSFEEMKR